MGQLSSTVHAKAGLYNQGSLRSAKLFRGVVTYSCIDQALHAHQSPYKTTPQLLTHADHARLLAYTWQTLTSSYASDHERM